MLFPAREAGARSIRHPDLSDVKKKTFVSHLFENLFADFYFI